MQAASLSTRSEINSPDLLTLQSEQIMLTILSFLDLKSLENLQLTNRRIRQLFITSLWKNLYTLTFRPHISPLGILSMHELFRRKYFQRHPQELKQLQEIMKMKRVTKRIEIRRLKALEREKEEREAEERAWIEALTKKCEEEIEQRMKAKKVKRWMLGGLILLVNIMQTLIILVVATPMLSTKRWSFRVLH